MDRLEEIKDLYAFDRWASKRVLDAVAALDDEAREGDVISSFPSIRKTLLHMLAADWIWLRRWKGEAPTAMPEGWPEMRFDALRIAWAELEAERTEFVGGLTAEDLDRPLTYRDMKGDTYTQPQWQLLRHVVNHGSYHRGQVATLLRQVGAKPTSIDMALYHREKGMTHPPHPSRR